jgi:hypothetical protein
VSLGRFIYRLAFPLSMSGTGTSSAAAPGISSSAKYWVLIVLGLILSVGTYLLGQPMITEAVILTAVLTGATFLVHEFETTSSGSS